MKNSKLIDSLRTREISVTLENILDNSRADSGGERDINFLKFLIDNGLLLQTETLLKRTGLDTGEEYYLERYKKTKYESDRHFLCRTIIQDELKRMGMGTMNDMGMGDMNILRSDCNYDIVTEDFGVIIDVGLTPARNYFRGLTDLRVKNYLITTYFDDYMDDIIFCTFARSNDKDYVDAVREYEEGFKQYIPTIPEQAEGRMYYN